MVIGDTVAEVSRNPNMQMDFYSSGMCANLTGFLFQQLDLLLQVLDDLVGLGRPLLQPHQRVVARHPQQASEQKPK